MHKHFILFFFLLFNKSNFAQNTIDLIDTVITDQRVTMTLSQSSPFTPEIDSLVDHRHQEIRTYVSNIRTFVPDSLVVNAVHYDSNYLYTFIDLQSQEKKVCVQNKAGSFDTFAVKDTMRLRFNSRLPGIEDFEFKVEVDDITESTVTFQFLESQYAYIEELDKYVTVWPFIPGSYIDLDDKVQLHEAYSELIWLQKEAPLDSNKQIRFYDYDYLNRKISYQISPLDSALISHRTNTYVDSLLVPRGKAFLLYFGGEWCRHCRENLPLLKKASLHAGKHDVHTLAILTHTRYNLKETKDYYNRHLFPIDSKIIPLTDSLLHELKITYYPSYILVDKSGLIWFRSDVKGDDYHHELYQLITRLND
ncbi:TlpA family protein disulfide reductase [Portibacter marinus]|uniref:TlpA family protein disulfide reductase n=1 Tax=Portibacter marinus TaxID=2898660 RepID=UPI001F1BB4DA|nr:thioredoxin-like domain-containing protein [Portibacter marinus]